MWGFDPYVVGGSALVTWWTMYDWAIWIAYAPLMGIFFAMIAYGRTVRQFMTVNFLLPAGFGFVWFAVWGSTALDWQISGKADIIAAIQDGRRCGRYLGVPEACAAGRDHHPRGHHLPHRRLLYHR